MNTMTTQRLGFGLQNAATRAFESGALAVWGARAILRNGTIDLVWDRQDCAVRDGTPEPEIMPLKRALCRKLDQVTGKVRQTVWDVDPRSSIEIQLHDDGDLVIVGNPNSSHGYLYMAAWTRQDPRGGA